MKDYILKKCKDDNVEIHAHCNSIYCSQRIIEVNPAKSCQFHCQYCCVYTQEIDNKFIPLTIYEDYPELLENYIKNDIDRAKTLTFFFSFETDCLEEGLIKSGMTERIIKIFQKYDLKYFLLTKGRIKDDNIKTLLIDTKNIGQIIVNDTMPDELIRKKLEPFTATNSERYELVKFCIENDIPVTVSFSPILPFYNIEYLMEKIDKYIILGIKHFRLDMLELSKDSFKKLAAILPEYENKMRELYFENEPIINKWKSPITNNFIYRYKPNEHIISDIYFKLKEYIKNKNKDITLSICDGIVANSTIFKTFNVEAYKNGYNCMGIRIK